MKRKFATAPGAALLGALLLSTSLPAAAQAPETPRSISVTGQGEASGTPDRATVNAGVQIRAATVIEAAQENQAVVERLIAALLAEDVDRKDIQTADYSVWPEQRYDQRGTGEATIVGYNVNNTVRVTVRDLDRLGALLAAVTNAGANTIHGISFSVEDPAALEAAARAAAMADARARASSLAELAGVELGEVLHISMSSGGGRPYGPMPAMRMAVDAAPEPSIMTGELAVSVQVEVVYGIQP